MAVFWFAGPDTNALVSASMAILVQVALHLVMFFDLAATVCAAAMWVAVVTVRGRGRGRREFGEWPRGVLAGVLAGMGVLLVLAVGLGVASLWFFWVQPLYLCVVGGSMVIVLGCIAVSGAVVLRRLRDSATLHTNRKGADNRRKIVAIKVMCLAGGCILYVAALLCFFLFTGPVPLPAELLMFFQFGINLLFVLSMICFGWLLRIAREDTSLSSNSGSSPRLSASGGGRATDEEATPTPTEGDEWEQSAVVLR